MSDVILFAHPTFGVLAVMAAVWVFVEALNANGINQRRLRLASLATAIFMAAAIILGGYWYVTYYAAEKAIILKGPWPFAHTVVMETKEHLVFVPMLLALYLPILTRVPIVERGAARAMVLAVAALMALTALAAEGAGAIINYAVKIAYVHTGA